MKPYIVTLILKCHMHLEMTSFQKRQNLISDSQFNYSQIVIAAVHLSHKLNKLIKQV